MVVTRSFAASLLISFWYYFQENVSICAHLKVIILVLLIFCSRLCLLLKRAIHTPCGLVQSGLQTGLKATCKWGLCYHATIHSHPDHHGHLGITPSTPSTVLPHLCLLASTHYPSNSCLLFNHPIFILM